MMNGKLVPLILLSVLASGALLIACSTVSTAAQMAGSFGVIDQKTADTISTSSEAFGKAVEEITPEQEYYIGRAVAANVVTTYRIWEGNPALTAYLNRIVNALTINSPRPDIYNGYHVMILDSQEINAFSTAGGHIYITRGLIACTDSEDALAAILAHEIAHTQLQHSIKSIKTSRFTEAILVTGSSAANAAGMSLGEQTEIFGKSVSESVTTLVNNGYSQSQEFDADNTALSLMAAAGYEPSCLIDMLRQLEKNQPGHLGGFNKTHPAPARRIENAEKSLGKYSVPDTRSYRKARYEKLRPTIQS
jgi:predicted Zn-dependent protease